jgi:hypothetical protein
VSKVRCFIWDTKCNAIKAASETKEEADIRNSILSEKITPYNFDKIKCCISPAASDKIKKTK